MGFCRNLELRRTDLIALFAIDAGLLISMNSGGRKFANDREKRPHRAEIAAEIMRDPE